MLLFPKPSALKDIYWDPKNNQKSPLYGTGILGPPHLFTTLSGDTHRDLRKALGGQQWSIGSLKNKWEPRVDDQVSLFVRKMTERVETHETVCISDKVAEFAADIMTMLSFTQPFGFVEKSRDERNILTSWRQGLDFFGFAGRSKFFQHYLMHLPGLGSMIFPKLTDEGGMGWLMGEANRQVNEREELLKNDSYKGEPDFLQQYVILRFMPGSNSADRVSCLDARRDGQPLTDIEKRSHVTLLIQAGADTTGTGLGSTLRYLIINPDKKKLAQQEIDEADRAGKLSTPVKYEEVRQHLPYFSACIKEGLRLDPPATNLFARTVIAPEGKTIDGHFVPPGMDITSNAYVVQRDPELYAPDPTVFRPERWLENKEKANEMESASFVFGIGSRVCLGKEIAIMELYKLLPEVHEPPSPISRAIH